MPDGTPTVRKSRTAKRPDFKRNVEIALRRAARTARKVARMHGTPVYFMRDGKIVAERP